MATVVKPMPTVHDGNVPPPLEGSALFERQKALAESPMLAGHDEVNAGCSPLSAHDADAAQCFSLMLAGEASRATSYERLTAVQSPEDDLVVAAAMDKPSPLSDDNCSSHDTPEATTVRDSVIASLVAPAEATSSCLPPPPPLTAAIAVDLFAAAGSVHGVDDGDVPPPPVPLGQPFVLPRCAKKL